MAASSVVKVTKLDPSGIPTFYSLAGGGLTSTYYNGVRSSTVYGSTNLGWQDAGTVPSFNDVLAAATDVTYLGNSANNSLAFSSNLTNGSVSMYGGVDTFSASIVSASSINTGSGNDSVTIAELKSGSTLTMESGNDVANVEIVDSATVSTAMTRSLRSGLPPLPSTSATLTRSARTTLKLKATPTSRPSSAAAGSRTFALNQTSTTIHLTLAAVTTF
jgi:hypothetical protein